jgi:hypothetical protein
MGVASLSVPSRGEMRNIPRKRVLLGGVVAHDEGHYSFGCTIRDLTESSARITIPPRYLIPRELYLIRIKAGFAHRARVVWSGKKEAGLCLLGSLDLRVLGDPRFCFLRQIWEATGPR